MKFEELYEKARNRGFTLSCAHRVIATTNSD